MEKIILTVTENQLRLIQNMSEEYFRLRMGQAWDFADDICGQNIDMSQTVSTNDQIFQSYIRRRDLFRGMLEALIRYIAFEGITERCYKTDDMLNAIDMWHVIRHWLWEQRPADEKLFWTTASDTPHQVGTEPLPKIEKVEV